MTLSQQPQTNTTSNAADAQKYAGQSPEEIEQLLYDIQTTDPRARSGNVKQRLVNALEQYLSIVRARTQEDEYATAYTDIISFLSVILRNLWIIILTGVIGAGLAFLVINMQTRIYETQTSVVVLPSSAQNAIPRPIEEIEIALGTYIQVLRSRQLLDEVNSSLTETYTMAELSEVDVVVRPVENSAIIVITVQAPSPELVQAYANKMAQVISVDNPIPQFEIAYQVDVLDAAYLPISPTFPEFEESIILTTIGSLIFGVMLAFLRDTYMKNRT